MGPPGRPFVVYGRPRMPRRRPIPSPPEPARSSPPLARPPPALAKARFPVAVLDVLRRLDAAGHRSWLVGGAVRDVLLRRARAAQADLDVATPARPEQVQRLFPRVIPTGIEHGTVTVLSRGVPVEVTTFRGEGAYLDGRRPSSVTFLDDVDGDLARRDFTVNALAWDPLGGVLRDPFGGRADLRRKVLRAVGDPAARFAEDGLRPLRAARFAAQLGFHVDPATAAAIRPALPVAARVSAERLCQELSKLLVARQARRGLVLLEETGLASLVLPDLVALPPGDLRHGFDAAAAATADLVPRLAAARRVREALRGLRFPGQVADEASRLVLDHGCVLAPGRASPPTRDADVRRWLARVEPARAPAVLALWAADAASARPAARSRRERAVLGAFRARQSRVLRQRPPLAVPELALDGQGVMKLLGLPGGPSVGEALRHLLTRALEDPALNTPVRLASELKAWWASRSA